ncbi:MAG TPA: purine-nucleoside phosphorylase [Anaerolineaceae bacterium]|jgi:purine-nucleoside phosphorylase|nr:purine-nucleoside phosphorylase [Anaerolineaceae bacterium]
MSIHIGAKPGQIAPTILLPGDPLRAKFIAETMLKDAVCFNEVRGMLGFTGTYNGKRVSVMGTGMGMPSHSIYVNELIREYQVKNLIRVGTCGGIQLHLKISDVILAITASTDSHMDQLRFSGMTFAAAANFELLAAAYRIAKEMGETVHVGSVLSSDTFYNDHDDWWKLWAENGVLGVEMETCALYSLAAKHGVRALSILTVSDGIAVPQVATTEQREKGFPLMAKIALRVAEELE